MIYRGGWQIWSKNKPAQEWPRNLEAPSRICINTRGSLEVFRNVQRELSDVHSLTSV
jgi:hypothetical protein